MKIHDEVCPMTKAPCRHCSMETTTRSFTRVEKDPKTHLFKSMGLGRKKVELGVWCNNDGKHYVKDLAQCPNTIPITHPLKMPGLGVQKPQKATKKKIKIVKKKPVAVPQKKVQVAQGITSKNADLSRWMKPCKKQTNTRKK